MQPRVCGRSEVRGSFWEKKTLCSHLKAVADARSPGLCSAFFCLSNPEALASSHGAPPDQTPSAGLSNPVASSGREKITLRGRDPVYQPRDGTKRHFCFDQRVRSAVYRLVLHLSVILNASYLLITRERRASAAGSSLQHNVCRVPTYALGCSDIKEPRQENAKTNHTKNNAP